MDTEELGIHLRTFYPLKTRGMIARGRWWAVAAELCA